VKRIRHGQPGQSSADDRRIVDPRRRLPTSRAPLPAPPGRVRSTGTDGARCRGTEPGREQLTPSHTFPVHRTMVVDCHRHGTQYRRAMSDTPHVVWMPGGVRTEIHLDSADTAGAFCLLVDHPPAGWLLPSHLHIGVAETIHIVDGVFEVTIDGASSRIEAGQTVHIPADTEHSSTNLGPAGGRRVLLFSPAGMERFFLEVGAPSADIPVAPDAALASALRHGWRFT
jgi:quercetin dioxygenase-like cupin family protein